MKRTAGKADSSSRTTHFVLHRPDTQESVPTEPATVRAEDYAVELVCPRCKGPLSREEDKTACPACDVEYSTHDGIPDLRTFPDPYLSLDEDHDRTEKVLHVLRQMRLIPLLEYYWSLSDITPEALRAKFVRNAQLGEQRAKRIIRLLADGTFTNPVRPRRVLDVGSGTGNFLTVVRETYGHVVGADIAMRWLHVSRRRFYDRDESPPPLVCCCAEDLPFPDASFDLVVLNSTMEFLRDPERAVRECARVLSPQGVLFINTVNRYSIARNPYAYLWGVGFLPRRWQAAYVRWRRGASYQQICLRSLREIKRMAHRYFDHCEIELPDIDDESLRYLSAFTRLQVRIYRLMRKTPGIRGVLKWIGLSWDVKLSRPVNR